MDKEFILIMMMLAKESRILETEHLWRQKDNFGKTFLYEDVSSYYTFEKLFKMFILQLFYK